MRRASAGRHGDDLVRAWADMTAVGDLPGGLATAGVLGFGLEDGVTNGDFAIAHLVTVRFRGVRRLAR